MTDASDPRPDRFMAAALRGGLVAAGLALLGGLLLHEGGGAASFGSTMFLILPAATGFVTGYLIRPFRACLLATVLSIAISMLAQLVTGLEGVVCILMASPLIAVAALAGVVIGHFSVGLSGQPPKNGTHLLLLPFLAGFTVLGGGCVENRLGSKERFEDVVSTWVAQAEPEEVWNTLLTVDELTAPKPFLLRIGLPVPRACRIDGSGVGAHRICLFENGDIEEEITGWEAARNLEMRITRSTVPGRHWLHFESASYRLERLAPGQTQITRTTRISSMLRPAWYWRWFEHVGVEAEHCFLFESLFPAAGSK